jgi:hypothetical protein
MTTKDDIADEAFISMVGHDPMGAHVVVFPSLFSLTGKVLESLSA